MTVGLLVFCGGYSELVKNVLPGENVDGGHGVKGLC